MHTRLGRPWRPRACAWRRPLAAALLAALSLAPGAALGQSDEERATARDLAQEGHAALARKDFITAADRFGRAETLFHAPTLMLGLARAQAGLGKVVAAHETYNRIVREPLGPGAPPAFVAAQDEARAELAALAPRVPRLTILLAGEGAGAGARVTLDGTPVPAAAIGVRRAVEPGTHQVVASAEGFADARTTVELAEGASTSLTLLLERVGAAAPATTAMPAPEPGAAPSPVAAPAPDAASPGSSGPPTAGFVPAVAAPAPDAASPRSSGLRTAGFVVGGLGLAGLVAGAVAGGLAMAKNGELAAACPDGHCPANQSDALDGFRSTADASTVGLAAGGALTAAGAVMLIWAASSPGKTVKPAAVVPLLGVGAVGAAGRF